MGRSEGACRPGQPGANPQGEERGRARAQGEVVEIDKRLVRRGRRSGPLRGAGRGRGRAGCSRSGGGTPHKLWNGSPRGATSRVRCGVWRTEDHGEGVRLLGVPYTADRVATRRRCCWRRWSRSPRDSYGYRPGRSAHDALAVCRRRCWAQDWVRCSMSGPFSTLSAFPAAVGYSPHQRVVGPVVHLRWLTAPLQLRDGTIVPREKGPLRVPRFRRRWYLLMHYVFDMWMDRVFPGCPFERSVDDIVAHCDSGDQARELRVAIAEWFGTFGLEMYLV